ncbi:MAG: hypothetical protein ACI9N9_002148, partial [Enterobacterales bacterium]
MSLRAQRGNLLNGNLLNGNLLNGNLLTDAPLFKIWYKTAGDCHVVPPR